MKTLNRNAAAMLFEKARELGDESHSSWRCIYINLSAYRLRHSHMLLKHFVGRAITELLADADGYVYMCNDGDIFILFQGALKPIVNKLGEHFGDLSMGDDGQPADSAFTILDLSRDWQVFFNLCAAKSRQQAPLWQEMPVAFSYRNDNSRETIPQE